MCSGNRRGFSQPHVAGVQWGQGAIATRNGAACVCATCSTRPGLKKDAVEIVLQGAMAPSSTRRPIRQEPSSLEGDGREYSSRVRDERRKVAALERFSRTHRGSRWTATYWMKHVTSITAVSQPFKGFWMNPAYRIPKGKFPVIDRFVSQETETKHADHRDGGQFADHQPRRWQESPAGRRCHGGRCRLDGGYGIATVEVSEDEGKSGKRRNSARISGAIHGANGRTFCAGTAGPVHRVDEGDQSRWRHADIRADIQSRRLP